nr:monoglyceride lipase-like [Paramormyrops kingsleyae]
MSESGVTPQGDRRQDHIVNADGQRLFCRSWVPEVPPRGLLFVAHGVGEHCGRYSSLAQSLSRRGLMVFAHDHGDGGAICILCACERPSDFTGVVLISPMVQLNPESASPFKVFMAKLLNHVLPSLSLGSIDSKWISRDQKEVESYDKDELNHHGGLSVAFAMQLVGAARLIERAIPTVTWPFLLLHGDADKLCNISGSHMMLEKAQSTDKQLKVYSGAYHALHRELPETTDSVLRDIGDWVVGRIPDQAASGS